MTIKLIRDFDWQQIWPEGHAGKRVLDLACGSGHNGAWFAGRGCRLDFIDRDLGALAPDLTQAPHSALARDLEDGSAPSLPHAHYDLILVVNYLHRPLLAQIIDAIKPGGLLLYETFTREQALLGRPRNPDFLLRPGELEQECRHLRILHSHEGPIANEAGTLCHKAQLIAQRRQTS